MLLVGLSVKIPTSVAPARLISMRGSFSSALLDWAHITAVMSQVQLQQKLWLRHPKVYQICISSGTFSHSRQVNAKQCFLTSWLQLKRQHDACAWLWSEAQLYAYVSWPTLSI